MPVGISEEFDDEYESRKEFINETESDIIDYSCWLALLAK
jgi:hypothetical protein